MNAKLPTLAWVIKEFSSNECNPVLLFLIDLIHISIIVHSPNVSLEMYKVTADAN